MYKAVKITIDRAEGPSNLCGPKTFEGPNVWAQAQRCIDEICETAPKTGGYDKTDFKVIFADGEEYTGRIDLSHPSYEKRDITNLADHIAQHCHFHLGLWRPSHMSVDQYRDFLAQMRRFHPEIDADLRRFSVNYEVPSQWAKHIQSLSSDGLFPTQ